MVKKFVHEELNAFSFQPFSEGSLESRTPSPNLRDEKTSSAGRIFPPFVRRSSFGGEIRERAASEGGSSPRISDFPALSSVPCSHTSTLQEREGECCEV